MMFNESSVRRSRGRPKMGPEEAREKSGRLEAFGTRLKELREGCGLTLAAAAEAAGIDSSRKLSQYETKCYPPGEVLRALAPVYGVGTKYLAALKMWNSDRCSYLALSDNRLPEEFINEAEAEV